MRKRIAAFVLALCTLIPSVNAQSIFKAEDNRAYWGLRLDVDVNLPGNYNYEVAGVKVGMPTKHGGGFAVGGIYNIPVVANLYFEPGAMFYYDTYRLDEVTGLDDNGMQLLSESPKIEKLGFRIPLNVGYRFDIWENASLSFYTGPEFAIGLSAKVKSKLFNNDEDFDDNLYSDDNVLGTEASWHRFTASWNIGVQLTFNKHLTVGLSGNIGMSDLVESQLASFHENALRVSLGYNF